MPTIIITGGAGAGKTSLAGGLLLHLRDGGRSAAYYKPFSALAGGDGDYLFVADVLADAIGIAAGPPPQPPSADVADAAAAIAELRRRYDAVIVEVAAGGPAAELAAAVDGRVLEVRGWPGAGGGGGRRGGRLAGVVVNTAPLYRLEAAREVAGDGGVAVPESRLMLAATVAQIGDCLEAVWTLAPVNAGALVERYLIGGNIMDNSPAYYGRYANQAVITRVRRPDIQLACMRPETRCLVLTGDGEPAEYVKAEARERDIPLLEVGLSTLEAADALSRLLPVATVHSIDKIRHFAGLLERYAGAERLAAWLG